MSDIATPLNTLHSEWGGKMTGFAGYLLPLSYAGGGFIAEHVHTRNGASLFDVSHMGQAILSGDNAASALSRLTPADVSKVPAGSAKYALLTNDKGGVLDDFIVGNESDGRGLFIVFNASRKKEDLAHLQQHISDSCEISELSDWALAALQGPKAEEAASAIVPELSELGFMQTLWFEFGGKQCRAARCGYTGEDGFEFSLPPEIAEEFVRKLAAHPQVQPAGLGARDSLRLEAGLCLYGNELDETITPIEAGLTWAINKHRREGGDYLGAEVIAEQIGNGPKRRLVGLLADGRKVARTGAVLADADGGEIGVVTSGVFSPTLQRPVALGFVASAHAEVGNSVFAKVRGDSVKCEIVKPPFVAHQYKRAAKS